MKTKERRYLSVVKLTGTLEVFQNQKGYITGVFKAFDDKANTVTGKCYMDVALPESVKVKEGQTLTLELKKAYLNAVHVEGENAFTKLKINVVDCEVIRVFPEEKEVKKTSKKGAK